MINELNFHGNWKTAGNRYSELDFKILKNEKAQNRFIDKYKDCSFDFDFHFYKGPKNSWDTSLQGCKDSEWVKENFDIDIEPKDDKISVLITSNVGSPKYPLTPWIIAHRISHSLWSNNAFQYYFPLMRKFENLVGTDAMYTKWFGCAIGTMRSCRQRTLARTGEIFHELFAQNLLTGRIDLNHVDNRILVRKRWKNEEYRYFSDSIVEEINSTIDRLENAVYNVASDLDGMYGNIIVV